MNLASLVCRSKVLDFLRFIGRDVFGRSVFFFPVPVLGREYFELARVRDVWIVNLEAENSIRLSIGY